MASLVDYLKTLPGLSSAVHARPPSTLPSGPHVVWEASAGSSRLALFNEEGEVWARTIRVFLYVPDTMGRSDAAELMESIAGATKTVDEWPDLHFWGLGPGGDLGPVWDGNRWTANVNFTLLYLRH